jgi:hypothetical protein
MTDPAAANQLPPESHDKIVEGLPARVRDMATLRGLGFKCLEIGRRFGISAQAVSITLARYRHRHDLLGSNAEMLELSSRAVNALSRIGVTTREGVRRDEVLVRLQGERNCGAKTVEEIRRWLERGG